MTRRICAAGVCLLLVAGCGGVKPVSFSDKSRPLASTMQRAVKDRDLEAVDKTIEVAQQRLQQKSMLPSEFAVLESCQQSAKEDKWDDAASLIGNSLERQK
jgi:hypothetical protein